MKNADKKHRKIVSQAKAAERQEQAIPPAWMRIAFAGAHGPGTRQVANRQHARQTNQHPANPRRK